MTNAVNTCISMYFTKLLQKNVITLKKRLKKKNVTSVYKCNKCNNNIYIYIIINYLANQKSYYNVIKM